jgi:cyclopropane-fatty-acyl-phospholipid synthase
MFRRATELSLAEAYIYGDFDIEGDIEEVFPLGSHLLSQHRTLDERLRQWKSLASLPFEKRPRVDCRMAQLRGPCHSQERDRQAIAHHYDLSNEFYALWLDKQMVYSCAYFSRHDDDLNVAQARKLDYICHKLRLRRGERLLDIGCGWGGLIVHAVRHYGVNAVGITLSQKQAEFANTRIRQCGIADRCRIEVNDYRNLSKPCSFNKIVSIGMLEHVGEAQLSTYFDQAWRLLLPCGVFLNRAIAIRPTEPVKAGPLAQRYVFPDGELVPIGTTLRIAETSGFEVCDVESLREHYLLTLRRWLHRLEASHDIATALVGEVVYRIFRLYLSSSAYGFRTGRFDVYQTLLSKPDRGVRGLPLTRDDWALRAE